MCGLWPPRTATWRLWSTRESFARIYGIGVPCSPLFSRHCAGRFEDIPELARHFAERAAAARFVLSRALPTPEDNELLSAYSWPGDVRELAAVIDRAAILGDGKRLEVAKALGVTADLPATPPDGDGPRPAKPAQPNRFPTLDEAMQKHIEAALTLTHGRIEGRRGMLHC